MRIYIYIYIEIRCHSGSDQDCSPALNWEVPALTQFLSQLVPFVMRQVEAWGGPILLPPRPTPPSMPASPGKRPGLLAQARGQRGELEEVRIMDVRLITETHGDDDAAVKQYLVQLYDQPLGPPYWVDSADLHPYPEPSTSSASEPDIPDEQVKRPRWASGVIRVRPS